MQIDEYVALLLYPFCQLPFPVFLFWSDSSTASVVLFWVIAEGSFEEYQR